MDLDGRKAWVEPPDHLLHLRRQMRGLDAHLAHLKAEMLIAARAVTEEELVNG